MKSGAWNRAPETWYQVVSETAGGDVGAGVALRNVGANLTEEVISMPANAKRQENISKHMTKAKIKARSKAEEDVVPRRAVVRLVMPDGVKRDPIAVAYWTATTERMLNTLILDDLDSDMLGIYCCMLSRWDALNDLCRKVIAETQTADASSTARIEGLGSVDTIISRLQALEKGISSYANCLGLTPAGRVRLARKRADAAAGDEDSDDLFGD